VATSRKEKVQRWAACEGYIRRAPSLPEAMALAKRERFAAPTAAWLTALSKMLERGDGPCVLREPG
jgi:hypothetical protein